MPPACGRDCRRIPEVSFAGAGIRRETPGRRLCLWRYKCAITGVRTSVALHCLRQVFVFVIVRGVAATSTNMVRLRGRCPRGERLIDHVPHGHWKTITFVAGLRRRAMVAPLVLDGPMNATTFVAYLKECLVPKLKRGDVVMMDSLPVHRVAGVREVIEAAGAKLRCLPKYSPDLNPIEQAFSKLKAHLRKAAERTIPRLSRRIGALVAAFSPQECTNYFRHAGYAST